MFVLLHRLQRLRRDTALPGAPRSGSLALRHVDAGSCNGCEHELTATANPLYDLQRFGLNVVASPRHADVLLVTGPITTRMVEPPARGLRAMPEPRLVAAARRLRAAAAACSATPTSSPARSRTHPARRLYDPRLPADARRRSPMRSKGRSTCCDRAETATERRASTPVVARVDRA